MTARTGFDNLLIELKKTRDELRLQMHLAGMEARTTWEKLEPKVDELERKVNAAGDAATHELEAAFDTLGKALARLRDDVVPPPSGPRL